MFRWLKIVRERDRITHPPYTVFAGSVAAGSGVTLLARVLGANGEPITQATLTAVTAKVTNLNSGSTGAAITLTISSVVFDALQQSDPRWTFDSVHSPGRDGRHGYNFCANLESSNFALATVEGVPPAYPPSPVARLFQVDVKFDPVTGQDFKQSWRIAVLPTFY